MISLTNTLQNKRKQQGFTIVELLIVIVVIGILAALVVTTYAGIQAKARDSKRVSDVQGIQQQLEAFYTSNNYYPTAVDFNSSTWRAANNLKNLDTDLLKDPSGTLASLSTSTATASGKQYGYVAQLAGAACTTAAAQCDAYTLTAYLENKTPALYSKTNAD